MEMSEGGEMTKVWALEGDRKSEIDVRKRTENSSFRKDFLTLSFRICHIAKASSFAISNQLFLSGVYRKPHASQYFIFNSKASFNGFSLPHTQIDDLDTDF